MSGGTLDPQAQMSSINANAVAQPAQTNKSQSLTQSPQRPGQSLLNAIPDVQSDAVSGNLSATSSASVKNPLPALPTVTLPKGGGSISSIGEKYTANSMGGSGSMSIPIQIPAGRHGFQPQLSLNYDSGSGNGPFGLGWKLSLPIITRKTDKGLPRYRDPTNPGLDVFILGGAEDLMPLLEPTTSSPNGVPYTRAPGQPQVSNGINYNVYFYRPRVEASFSRIELWISTTAPETDMHWRSFSAGNVVTIYGIDNNSRISDPQDPSRIFSWLASSTSDSLGNIIIYEYKAEDSVSVSQTINERNRNDVTRSSNRYIKRIRYGNQVSTLTQPDTGSQSWLFEVVFDYGDHPSTNPTPQPSQPWLCRNDPFSSHRSGFEIRTYRLCQRVFVFHNFPNEPNVGDGCLVKSTNFFYQNSRNIAEDVQQGNPNVTLLASTSVSGFLRSGSTYSVQSVPPLEFQYIQPTLDPEVKAINSQSLENLPMGLDGLVYQWIDLDGEGISGLLTQDSGSWFYKRNLGDATFGPLELLPSKPSLASIGPNQPSRLLDLDGSGRLDIVQLGTGVAGFSTRTFDGDWEAFTTFASLPNIDFQDKDLQLIDVTGDGLPDVLISEQQAFVMYPSLGLLGFDQMEQWFTPGGRDEEKGPRLLFSDPQHTIFLGDMTGSGLSDLVRIRNSEICYWPSQGYGRFGTKVTMANSPWLDSPDLFDPLRVRLGDVDGSGTTDLVYLGADGNVYLYFNWSGNSYSAPIQLEAYPPVDNLASVKIVDLFGSGTGCLVWSSSLPGDQLRRMSYIDLMGSHKPYMLSSFDNNMGGMTKLSYQSSTYFYLKDRREGHPWITRIPFPVQVVEKIEVFDSIAGSYFSNRFAYSHGFYDGVEREYRGFGRVYQWDTEDYSALDSKHSNTGEASFIPPILTKTWYHTGAYVQGQQVSQQMAVEYFQEPGLTESQLAQMMLPDSAIPNQVGQTQYTLLPDEMREAVRSLKGKTLRTEVYGLDKSKAEHLPYSVSEMNYSIKIFQPQGPNQYGVYYSHELESVTFNYERQTFSSVAGAQVADPRVSHSFALLIDDYGNTLQSLSLTYGRRYSDSSNLLTVEDRAKQSQFIASISLLRYTNPILLQDAYRTPLPCEAQSFQVLNYPLVITDNEITPLVQLADTPPVIQALLSGSFNIPFEDWEGTTAVPSQTSFRPLAHQRTIFRSDDFTTSLPLGTVQSLALPFMSYNQVLTPGLVQQIYITPGHLPSSPSSIEATLSGVCGYVHSEGDANWWSPSGQVFFSPNDSDTPAQEQAYAEEHFYLPVRFRDPMYSSTFQSESFVTYDTYDLLVVESVDPYNNRSTVGERNINPSLPLVQSGYDYRVLSPTLVMDSNRNQSMTLYDVLGNATVTAVMGKPEDPPVGDNLTGVSATLSDAQIEAYLSDPLADPGILLGNATSRTIYDLFQFYNTRSTSNPLPVVHASLSRETHVSDLSAGQQTRIQHSFSYVDGTGKIIQTKAVAEPDSGSNTPRWVASGWTIFNNKGNPVQAYEPFFTTSNQYESNVLAGVSTLTLYDTAQRPVVLLKPDHTWSKTIFDGWSKWDWDFNDTCLISDPSLDLDVGGYFKRVPTTFYMPSWYDARSGGALGTQEQLAAQKAAIHAATPSASYFDSMGRSFLSIADNKFQRSQSTSPTEQFYVARTLMDVSSNTRQVSDANTRLVETRDYDMIGTLIHSSNMDSGESWTLRSIANQNMYAWNSRGFEFRLVYDLKHRILQTFMSQGSTVSEMETEKIVYGETQASPESQNWRNQIVFAYDQAGVQNMQTYDFKGNLQNATRQFAVQYKTPIDWSTNVALDSAIYSAETLFDALNRPVKMTSPDGSILQPTFNISGQLQQVNATLKGSALSTPFMKDIQYDAKGQRLLEVYGNTVQTIYTYDEITYRVTNIVTKRDPTKFPNDCPTPALPAWPGCQIQSLHYVYDAVGNVTNIRDDAQQTIFFQNQRVEPSNDYTYDALYQLIEATGREHLGQGGVPVPYTQFNEVQTGLQHPNDGKAMGTYVENYFYDPVGNITSVSHQGSDPTKPAYTRTYNYSEPTLLPSQPAGTVNNRLTSTTIGSSTENYQYDGNPGLTGNITSLSHLSVMQWNYKDQLSATARQIVNSGTPETTFYVYDGSGQRIRRVTERQAAAGATATRRSERIYLGCYEIYREYAGDGTTISLERETLHIEETSKRFALIESLTIGESDGPAQLIRYQYTNKLGSVSIELDDTGSVISYEEYTPFGSSSYQGLRSLTQNRKRYRYTAKERDEESGFYYHGARYYMPWIGRWINPDPGGLKDGPNVFSYVGNNPVMRSDPTGLQGQPPYEELGPETMPDVPEVGAPYGTLKPIPPRSVNYRQARAEASAQNRPIREAGGITGRDVQVGHVTEARTVPESGVPENVWAKQDKPLLYSSSDPNHNFTSVDPHTGVPKVNTPHRGHDDVLVKDAVDKARDAEGKLSPEAHLESGDYVNWRTQGTPIDERNRPGSPHYRGPEPPRTEPEPFNRVSEPQVSSKSPSGSGGGSGGGAAGGKGGGGGGGGGGGKTAGSAVAAEEEGLEKAAASGLKSGAKTGLKTAAKVLGHAVAVAGVAYSAYEAFKDVKTADQAVDVGIQFTADQLTQSPNLVAQAGGWGMKTGVALEQNLHVSDYSSAWGVGVNEKLRAAGAGETTALIGGGVVTVVSTPVALAVSAYDKFTNWLGN